MAKAQVEKSEAKEKLVKVISLRQGDIVLSDGVVVKHLQVLDVPESCADWLEASFPGMVKRV